MSFSIVADIGGTNARFALATNKGQNEFSFEHINVLKASDFNQFEDALRFYMDSLEGTRPVSACVAIAGPVDSDLIKWTNSSWSFSKSEIGKRFGFSTFDVINDFAAVAIATSRLAPDDLTPIKTGEHRPSANKAVLGPGTGLGVAGLAHYQGLWVPVPGEGGHATLPPANAFEAELIKAGIARLGYVSAEDFVSGRGLKNLYIAVCDVSGVDAQPLEAHEITAAALNASDSVCVTTLNAFCCFLGTVTGNLVLTYGAKGGAYLAGGIVPRFVDFLNDSEFVARFCNKGIMGHYVEDVPINLINYEYVAFLGAASWLEQVS